MSMLSLSDKKELLGDQKTQITFGLSRICLLRASRKIPTGFF